jgi:hypothetical protein
MGGACSMSGEKRNAYRFLVGKSAGRRLLRTPRRRWVYDIKMDLWRDTMGGWTALVWLRIGTSGELL